VLKRRQDGRQWREPIFHWGRENLCARDNQVVASHVGTRTKKWKRAACAPFPYTRRVQSKTGQKGCARGAQTGNAASSTATGDAAAARPPALSLSG